MVDNIVVVDVLTCYALLHSVYDLKTVQMNIQCNLIWELMLYEFEQGHNAFETIKNICCAKEANPVSSTQRVSGELRISQSRMICLLYELRKSIWNSQIVPHVTKIIVLNHLQNRMSISLYILKL